MRHYLLFCIIFFGLMGCQKSENGEECIKPTVDVEKSDVNNKQYIRDNSKILVEKFRSQIEIRAVKAEARNGKIYIDGEVKNNTDQNFRFIAVKVIFLDSNGSGVQEAKAGLIPMSGSSKEMVLKPNYTGKIFGSNGFIPSDWAGEIRYELSDAVIY